MNTRQEIIDTLVSYLEAQETGDWRELKNSIIGKELLSYGAVLIQHLQMIGEGFDRSFDYTTADEKTLISIASVFGRCISFIRPAYIRIQLTDSDRNQLYFKPFDLKYTVGSAYFTNVEFARGTDEIVLYQGIPRWTGTKREQPYFNCTAFQEWATRTFPISETEVVTGQVLGNALPMSIYKMVQEAGSVNKINLSRYSYLQSGPDVACFKATTLEDRRILVQNADGVWGKKFTGDAWIYWLDPTTEAFSTNGTLTYQNRKLQHRVLSAAEAEETLAYARQSFAQEFLDANAVITKEQVRTFVNSYPYVLDSSVVKSGDTIQIWIKPTDPDDNSDYGDLEAELDLRGSIGISHRVTNGTAVPFRLIIEEISEGVNRADIASFLIEELSYANLEFASTINVETLASQIQSKYQSSVSVRFKTTLTGVKGVTDLNFIPIQGDINLIASDAENTRIGWDINSILYAMSRETFQVDGIPATSKVYGKFVEMVLSGDRKAVTTGRIEVTVAKGAEFSNGFSNFEVSYVCDSYTIFVGAVVGDKREAVVVENEQISLKSLESKLVPTHVQSFTLPATIRKMATDGDIIATVERSAGAGYQINFFRNGTAQPVSFYAIAVSQDWGDVIGFSYKDDIITIITKGETLSLLSIENPLTSNPTVIRNELKMPEELLNAGIDVIDEVKFSDVILIKGHTEGTTDYYFATVEEFFVKGDYAEMTISIISPKTTIEPVYYSVYENVITYWNNETITTAVIEDREIINSAFQHNVGEQFSAYSGPTEVGYVNYSEAQMAITNNEEYNVEYTSYSAQVTKSQYMVLSEEDPITWK